MALACDPDLVVLDEPTTGLDVTTQEQIIALLVDLRARLGTCRCSTSRTISACSRRSPTGSASCMPGSMVEIGAHRRAVRGAAASLHAGPDRLDSAHRRSGGRCSGDGRCAELLRSGAICRRAVRSHRAATSTMPSCLGAPQDAGGGRRRAIRWPASAGERSAQLAPPRSSRCSAPGGSRSPSFRSRSHARLRTPERAARPVAAGNAVLGAARLELRSSARARPSRWSANPAAASRRSRGRSAG